MAAMLHAALDGAAASREIVQLHFNQRVVDILAAMERLKETAGLLQCRVSFGVRF